MLSQFRLQSDNMGDTGPRLMRLAQTTGPTKIRMPSMRRDKDKTQFDLHGRGSRAHRNQISVGKRTSTATLINSSVFQVPGSPSIALQFCIRIGHLPVGAARIGTTRSSLLAGPPFRIKLRSRSWPILMPASSMRVIRQCEIEKI